MSFFNAVFLFKIFNAFVSITT